MFCSRFFFRASLYSGVAALKTSSLPEIVLRRLLIVSGSCARTAVGWLDLVFMYWCTLFGLLYGQYYLFEMFRVTSKKLTICRFVSMVILRSLILKSWISFFSYAIAFGPWQAVSVNG